MLESVKLNHSNEGPCITAVRHITVYTLTLVSDPALGLQSNPLASKDGLWVADRLFFNYCNWWDNLRGCLYILGRMERHFSVKVEEYVHPCM